jgi:anti-anti-sigma factor
MAVQDDHAPDLLRAFPLRGDIDIATAPGMLEALLAHADADADRDDDDGRLLIDCSALTFIDSSGLNALVTASKKTGRRPVLIDLPQPSRRVFEITGLDTVFEIVD